MHTLYLKSAGICADVLGAAHKVLANSGAGLCEYYYQNALQRELEVRGHEVAREVQVIVNYKGEEISSHLRADLVVDNCFIVELKSVACDLRRQFVNQTLTYMTNLNCPVGLLYNFGATDRQRYRICVLRGAGEGCNAMNNPLPKIKTDDDVKAKLNADAVADIYPPPYTDTHPKYPRAIAIYRDVLDAADTVQRFLGEERLDELYYRALVRELTLRGHRIQREVTRLLDYKGMAIRTAFTENILIDDCFVLSVCFKDGPIKLTDKAQALTYMRHLDFPLGLIYNFGIVQGERSEPLIIRGANTGFRESPDSPFYGGLHNRRHPHFFRRNH